VCGSAPPDILCQRPKMLSSVLPRWAEVGRETLSTLQRTAAIPGEMILTQLSDILGNMSVDRTMVLPGEAAREASSKILTHGCIAFDDFSTMGRLLTGFA
jgi:hypothetical protein